MNEKDRLIYFAAINLQNALIEGRAIVPGRHNGEEWMDWCISKATKMYEKIIKK